MHSTAKEHILLVLQRIKQALWKMDKEYGLAGNHFKSMRHELNTIATNMNTLSIFCMMNIESLEKLIDIIKNHVNNEEDPVIKADLNKLIDNLEKELVKK